MVERQHPSLSVVRQCRLLDISRSSVYSRSAEASQEDLGHMKLMDHQYLTTPFYGSRRFTVWLRKQGYYVNRKRVRRLMRIMGLKAIYRRPRTSKATPGHKIYPYLLEGMEITRPNQVWAADITYIPMAQGFLYLVVIMDWFSPTFPISSCLDPGNAPSSTRAIVVLLTNAVKRPIKLTKPSGGGVNWCSMGGGGAFTTFASPSNPSRHAPRPWLLLFTSDDLNDIRYSGTGWSPAIRSNTCWNTCRDTATSAS